jgi:hypothetical protein
MNIDTNHEGVATNSDRRALTRRGAGAQDGPTLDDVLSELGYDDIWAPTNRVESAAATLG